MIRRAFIAALLGLLVVLVPALPAQAATSAPITRYDVDVNLRDDGVAEVVMDFTMDFGQFSGRGPILQFSTKQYDGNDRDYWYNFEYSRPRVSSPTGARTDLSVDTSSTAVVWRIGNEDVVNRSAQDYRLEFTLKGIVVSDHPESGLDEFNWNVFSGNDSDVTNLTVTVGGPLPVERAACFTGSAFDQPCDSQVSDGRAVSRLAQLPPGQPLQVVAGFPAGTFGGVEQIRTRVPSLTVDVLAHQGLIPSAQTLLGLTVGDLLAVTNAPTQADTTDQSYFVEGYTESIGPESYEISFNLSPTYPTLNTFVLDSATRGLLDTGILAY